MATDSVIGHRFRLINDWCVSHGYVAGWPNFHHAIYNDPGRHVYGHFLLRGDVVDWRDVPASEYAARDLRTRFTGAHDYALRHGYQHGFPNFHQADYGAGAVYGTFLIKPGTCEWRDVSTVDLGLGSGDPTRYSMDRWFTGASDYAARSGFVAGMPNGHFARYGEQWVCGVFLFPHGKVEWQDIRGKDLGLPDESPPPPRPSPPPLPFPELTRVPRLVGLLSSQMGPLIQAAKLQYGHIVNPTGEIRSDRLRVVAQDPAAEATVPVKTRVNYRVELA